MNLTALLNFESPQYNGVQAQSLTMNDLMASSLADLIQHFFLQIAQGLLLIVSSRHTNVLKSYRDTVQLLCKSVDNIAMELVYVDHVELQELAGLKLRNLLLVDSFEAFLDVDIISHAAYYDTNEYYYIVLQQPDLHIIPQDIQNILEYCWTHQLINCNIQVQQSDGDIFMYTYFPYTPAHCDNVVPVQVNRYQGGNWQHRNFFPAKLRNFHRCPLAVVVRPMAPFLQVEKDVHNNNVLAGLEGHLLTLLSMHLNFRIDVVAKLLDHRGDSSTMLTEHSAHLGVGYLRKRNTLQSVTTTFPHHQNNLVACVLLNSHNLTTFEIFASPFDQNSWLTVLASFLCTFCVAVFINQRVATGSLRRKLPTFLSIVSMAFGVPLHTEPNHFPNRLLYMSWLWASFWMRSIYAALLYYVFRKHIRQPLPKRLLELIYRYYLPVMTRFTVNDILPITYFEQFKGMGSKVFNSSFEHIALQYLEQNMGKRLVAVLSHDIIMDYVSTWHRPGMFYILPEDVIHQQLTFFLAKHSFLVTQFDDTLMSIHSVGLMDYWTRRRTNSKYFKSTHLYEQLLIRNRELWSIYFVCDMIYFIAMILFVLELLSKKFKVLRKLFK